MMRPVPWRSLLSGLTLRSSGPAGLDVRVGPAAGIRRSPPGRSHCAGRGRGRAGHLFAARARARAAHGTAAALGGRQRALCGRLRRVGVVRGCGSRIPGGAQTSIRCVAERGILGGPGRVEHRRSHHWRGRVRDYLQIVHPSPEKAHELRVLIRYRRAGVLAGATSHRPPRQMTPSASEHGALPPH